MTKFEYMCFKTHKDCPNALNKYGNEGWELVNVVIDGDYKKFYFKREIIKEIRYKRYGIY